MKIKKGDYQYLSIKRRKTLLLIILLMAVALGLYFGAYHHFGTNQNWFTIFAVLVLLPAARTIVNFIMLLRAKGCSPAAHEQIEAIIRKAADDHAPCANHSAYDLYMTSEKKNFDLSHIFFDGSSVIALTEDPKCDAAAGAQHIRRLMQQNGFHGYTVKIFTSTKAYCTRLQQLLLQLIPTDAAGDETTTTSTRTQELRALLLNISL